MDLDESFNIKRKQILSRFFYLFSGNRGKISKISDFKPKKYYTLSLKKSMSLKPSTFIQLTQMNRLTLKNDYFESIYQSFSIDRGKNRRKKIFQISKTDVSV